MLLNHYQILIKEESFNSNNVLKQTLVKKTFYLVIYKVDLNSNCGPNMSSCFVNLVNFNFLLTAWSALGFGLPGNCPLRQTGLSTTGYNAPSRRKRSKEIIWFSPLFSQNFKTSIGNLTFTVVIKNFARNHKFKETFNTLKLSYSSSSNKGQLDIYGAKYSKMGQNKFVEDRL